MELLAKTPSARAVELVGEEYKTQYIKARDDSAKAADDYQNALDLYKLKGSAAVPEEQLEQLKKKADALYYKQRRYKHLYKLILDTAEAIDSVEAGKDID